MTLKGSIREGVERGQGIRKQTLIKMSILNNHTGREAAHRIRALRFVREKTSVIPETI